MRASLTKEGPQVSLSFALGIYHVLEPDELILVVCFVFPHRISNKKTIDFISRDMCYTGFDPRVVVMGRNIFEYREIQVIISPVRKKGK